MEAVRSGRALLGNDDDDIVLTENLEAAPAVILGILFYFVALLCFCKDLFPALLRWKRSRKRVIWFYGLIFVASTARGTYFLIIGLSSAEVMPSPAFASFFLLWWIPDFCLFVAMTSVLYFWAQVFCSTRNLFLFSVKRFRQRILGCELLFVTTVILVQLFLYILIVISDEARTTLMIVDQLYEGVLAVFTATLPVTTGCLLLANAVRAEQGARTLGLFKKLTVITLAWIVGRLARAFDIFSTLPSWSTWDQQLADTEYYWLYVAPLYLIMELIPELLVLVSTVSSELANFKFSAENMTKNQQMPADRLELLSKVKANIKRVIKTADLDFTGEVLGTGTFATVYKGFYNHQLVAIKCLDKNLHRDKAFFELFCHEVELMSTLRHPNVINFLGACIDRDDQIYIVTELADKGNLHEYLAEAGPISNSTTERWALEIANGLLYLHSLGILHRDLKSDNILVTEGLVCKTADFSVSRFKDLYMDKKTLTQQVGSLCWMAPEMLMAEEYDEKVDVYSYAIILWEMYARKRPYEEETVESIEQRLVQGARLPRPDGVPDRMWALIEACWAESPAHRPSFQEVVMFLHGMHAQGHARPLPASGEL